MSQNQDRWEKSQQLRNADDTTHSRKQRGTKDPLDEGEG